MPAGLHCFPGSSPSSVWPAAERFFVSTTTLEVEAAVLVQVLESRTFDIIVAEPSRLQRWTVKSSKTPLQTPQRQFRPGTSSVVVLGRTNRAVGRSLFRCSWGFSRRPVRGVLAARLAAVGVVASSSPALSCSQHLRQSAACGLTRRCSGPAVCAGLRCSPGSSPSSVWPAAERFFVRPHEVAAPTGKPRRCFATGASVGPPRRWAVHVSPRCSLCRLQQPRLQPRNWLRDRPRRPLRRRASPHPWGKIEAPSGHRALLPRQGCKGVVRPNQALQRTGSACGFTLLPRFQPAVGLAGR